MQILQLLLALDVQTPPGGRPADLDERLAAVVVPLLEQLDAHPEVRCALHVGGLLLRRLRDRHPTALGQLRVLAERGRVELLGGGFFDPLLVAIPERDATGQLQLMSGTLGELLAVKPSGVWLTGRTWDPALPGLLNRAGFQYTLVDEEHFLATELGDDDLDGHRITEREGFPLAVFPIRTALQRRLLAAEPGRRARVLRRFLGEREQRSALLAFDDLRTAEQVEALGGLLDELGEQGHWIKLRTCRRAMEKEPSAGRVYLPAVHRAEGLDDTYEGLGWVRFLVEYPEANTLHKRMLMASYRVQRMRAAVQEQARGADPAEREELRAALQQACTQLWRAQHHSVYWHGAPELGIYDPVLRGDAYRRLLIAERLANELLEERDDGEFVTREVDFDCDGHRELLVEAGAVGAIISPRRGGGLVALDLLEHDAGLANVLHRHEEPYHFWGAGQEVQLVVEGTPPVTQAGAPIYTPEQAARLWFDDQPRLSFVDRFLSADTTLQNWYRGRYRDVGDFSNGEYEVAKTLRVPEEGAGEVHLGRSGNVEVAGRRALVRIEKSYVFTLADPRLRLDYHLINRYFEPVRAWFAVEINLMLPGTGRGLPCGFRAVGAGGERQGDVAGPLDLPRVGYLELTDPARDLAACLYLEEPRDAWLMPVETVNRVGGEVSTWNQGIALLLHGDQDLWGAEEQHFSVRLDFLEL